MPTLIEKELERAIAAKLTPVAARPAPAAPAPARTAAAPPPRRSAQPTVRFSPMFADAPPSARRGRRILVGVSVAVHVLLFVAILLMPKRAQTIEEPALPIEIVFTAPVPPAPELTFKPAAPKPPPPKPKPRPEPVEEPPAPVAEAPKPLPKPVIPEVEAAPVVKVAPPRPKPEVKTGLLDEAPAGPAIVASRTSKSVVVASGFDGAAGSASSPARPGRVTEAAFDSPPAASRATRAAAGTVQESGFGEEAAARPKRERERPAGALDSEVEILSKPKPVYTDAARSLKLEGDVVLDVTFEATGRVVVLGIAQGLGHGLDEAAVEAAKKIRFNPARRDARPVDHTAKLRVVFRLA
jgi:TonB family protein